jgi:hypothetical protein
MPRHLTAPLAGAAVGLVLLADLLVRNPSLHAVAGIVLDVVILIAAAAALAGAASLAVRHVDRLVRRRGDAAGSVALLAGLVAMLVAGLRPGAGADDPAVGWLLTALVFPLVASIFGLLFVFTLAAARRAMSVRRRESAVMLAAAAVVLVALLPIGGDVGDALSRASGWALGVPLAAVFRGLLIATAAVAAVAGARQLLGIGVADD